MDKSDDLKNFNRFVSKKVIKEKSKCHLQKSQRCYPMVTINDCIECFKEEIKMRFRRKKKSSGKKK